jgi:hypothetical protein
LFSSRSRHTRVDASPSPMEEAEVVEAEAPMEEAEVVEAEAPMEEAEEQQQHNNNS